MSGGSHALIAGTECAKRRGDRLALGYGHAILFSMNPFWQGQTSGSYSLVFNAILNFDNLNAGNEKSIRPSPAPQSNGVKAFRIGLREFEGFGQLVAIAGF